ncbi:MAG TPA: amino acid adenylation domain-containing protein [Thermoanaerobaculia bacterium]
MSVAPNLKLSDKQRLLREKLLRQQGIAPAGHERIGRRETAGPAPLSFGQQRLWFLHQLDPASAAYHIPEAVRLHGALDARALHAALAELVRRHEALRTVFLSTDGEPVQQALAPFAPELPRADLAALPPNERTREASRLVSRVVQVPFDLSRGPLLRAVLLRLGEGDHVLVLAMHHIVSDGWSMGVLVRELTALYEAFARGAASPLPELPLQYADFAAWQRKRLQGEALESQLRAWRERLAGAPTTLELPTDRPRPATASSRGAREVLGTGRDTAAALRDIAQEQGATPFMVLAAALGVLLQRYSHQDEVLIGYPSANRSRPEVEGLIGFFLNTLVVRVDLTGDPRVPELVSRVREAVLWAESHQDLPFERLIDALELPRDLSRTPLFQVLFAFQNLPPSGGGRPQALSVNPFGFETDTAQFDLSFLLIDGPAGLFGDLRYRTDLFDNTSARRLAGHLEVLLAEMARQPGRPVSELPLVASSERHQLLLEWNDTATPYPGGVCLHRLIEEQAARTPEAPAVTFEGRTLTYAELSSRANRLARRLRTLGCGPETRVGVAMERSLELVTALLGAMKAGAAYVPLDPDYPRERLAFMLEDARPAVLLTQERLLESLPATAIPTLCLTPEGEELAAEDGGDLADPLDDRSLAYAIYTSGSTGRPKGAMVHHRGIRNRLLWMQEAYRLTAADTVLQKTPFSFDVSVWEFFWPLLAGARIVLAKPGGHRDASYMADLIAAEGVTVLHFVPSMLQAFLEEPDLDRCRSLRLVVASGEALLPELERRFAERLSGARLENLYGPTEASVDVTSWTCGQPGRRSVPIGRPIANTRIHLVDRGFRPSPIGVPGELLIGGVNVGRGYLGRPEMTAERFIPDPFSREPGARLYRTGDLARALADGAVEFLGRIDHQVKVRGFRIELGEIESALATHPAVREAAVALRDERGTRQLVAYTVPRPGMAASPDELRLFLRERLPEYMTPALFVTLDALPLSPNGKLDRRLLPAPDPSAQASPEYAPPETPAEGALAEIWAEVLGVERVGVNDNFFSLGGDSILSLRAVARARERGLAVTLQQVFQHQTVRELARAAGGEDEEAPPPVGPFGLLSEEDRAKVPEGIADAYPLARLQAGMLFHSELEPETAVYHDIFSSHVRVPFDEERMRQAVDRMVALHPALRTAFGLSRFSEPLQLVYETIETPLVVEDLRELAPEEQSRAVADWLEAERHRPFDWTRPPLVRFHVHRRNDDTIQFTLSFHHSVLDGWSAATLQTALFRHYLSLLRAPSAELPDERPPAATYRDFVAQERRVLRSPEAQELWRRQLSGATASRLPRWPVPAVEKPQARDVVVDVPAEATAGLRRLARSAGVPIKSVLLAVHLKVVAYLSGQPDGLTGVVANGRSEQGDGDRVMGLFLNMLPFRLRLGAESWRDLAVAAFELEREMLPWRRYPLSELQALYGGGQTLFDIAFNFTHFHVYQELGRSEEARGIELLEGYGYEEVNFPLGANFGLDLSGSHLLLRLNFNDGELAPRQAEAIGGLYVRALGAMAAAPERPHAEAELLSEEERARILAWGDGGPLEAPDLPVHLQIAERAASHAQAVAVAFGEERLTWAELDRRAGRIAARLRSLGIGPEDRVALFLERSPDLPAAILGVWRAGAAYVPLDPGHPAERLAWVLEDSAAAAVLTEEALLPSLPASFAERGAPVVRVDDLADEELAPQPPPGDWRENLAYVIYTSGSTGRPKGVMVEHGNLAATLAASRREHGWQADDVMPCLAPFSFDISLFELLNPLLAGGSVELIGLRPALDLERLVALLGPLGRITRLHAVPALMRRILEAAEAAGPTVGPLLENRFPRLRTVFVGGEAVPADLLADLRRVFPSAETRILYGPTEGTIICSSHRVPPAEEPPRPLLGRALPGVALRLCDAHGHLVPPGTPGEIRIGGAGVTRGYLGRPELTTERYVTVDDARFYRTGDLARWSTAGELEFLGRSDDQIKIRGFRIELGEIEAALAEHPDVAEAVAMARREVSAASRGASGRSDSGDLRLIAYAVPRSGSQPSPAELRDFLRTRLPEYMTPSTVVLLGELPLSAHGKVDRRALPAPDREGGAARSFVAPRTPTEETLAQIWVEVLGADRIGVHDSFLELGGHSLLAMQLITRVRGAFSIDLPLRALYETATLEELAVAVANAQAAQADADVLAQLLDELEGMGNDEIQAALFAETDEKDHR